MRWYSGYMVEAGRLSDPTQRKGASYLLCLRIIHLAIAAMAFRCIVPRRICSGFVLSIWHSATQGWVGPVQSLQKFGIDGGAIVHSACGSI
jgi:hypothetical protein